jgi:hypothetical protein
MGGLYLCELGGEEREKRNREVVKKEYLKLIRPSGLPTAFDFAVRLKDLRLRGLYG